MADFDPPSSVTSMFRKKRPINQPSAPLEAIIVSSLLPKCSLNGLPFAEVSRQSSEATSEQRQNLL